MHCFRCDDDSPGESGTCAICGKLLETDPDRYFKAGMEAMAAGDMDRAIGLLEDCIHLSPDHLSGRYNLGLSMALADRCDEALEQYNRIADQDPDYPGIYTALGQAAFGSYLAHLEQAESQREAMIRLLMKAIEQDPEDVDACFSLANVYVSIGKAKKALPWLRRALNLQPDSSAIYYVTARAFKMLGKIPEAAIMAQKSMQLADTDDLFREDIEQLLSDLQEAALPK